MLPITDAQVPVGTWWQDMKTRHLRFVHVQTTLVTEDLCSSVLIGISGVPGFTLKEDFLEQYDRVYFTNYIEKLVESISSAKGETTS